jgi:glycosyltransferase involved in cell wall biosynthesis
MVIGALIPAFNEADRIGEVVTRARRHVDNVVVIDDGSTDGTAAEARQAGADCISSPVRQGKGAALRKGIEAIRRREFTHVVLMDGDGQHDPDDIPKLAGVANETGADLVVGARTFVREGMPLPRYFSNTIGSKVASNMVGMRLSDSQCGFRLVRADKLHALRLRANKYEIEMELIIKAVAAGYRVAEAPVRTVYEDGQSRSKMRIVRDTVRICMWSLMYRYAGM